MRSGEAVLLLHPKPTFSLKLSIPGSAGWFFEKADADNNDLVDLAELTAVFLEAGLEDVDVSKVFKECDTLGDGVIHRNEWMLGFHKYMNDLAATNTTMKDAAQASPI